MVELPNQVIEIRFDAQPGGLPLTVEALSSTWQVLPGQRLDFTTAQGGRFRAAGIAGLRLSGEGKISGIGALVQAEWANLADWVRIEVVGLPLNTGDVPQAVYDPDQQGWDAPSLSGADAALVRLGVDQLLQLDPPPTGSAAVVAPAWPFPDPRLFLDVLRKSALADIAACLTDSDDADRSRLQAAHSLTRPLRGLHQPGYKARDVAKLSLETSKYIALAVHDGPVAVGLGFGTVDVPPSGFFAQRTDLTPPGTELGRDEYMVTATFTDPIDTYEYAAIGHRVAPPPPLAGLAARQTFVNRAMTRDGDESVAVRLEWSAPRDQVGVGLLAQHAATTLNTPRPNGSGGFQPYLTEHGVVADGNPPGELRPGVTMPEQPMPKSGSALTTYAVAPLDVHGRWGPWQLTDHTTKARAVQQPGIGEVSLALPALLPPTGPVAPGCILNVDVHWDWADRSPDRIEVSGTFWKPGPHPTDPPASFDGFQVNSMQGALTTPVTISFPAGAPTILAAPAGSPAEVVTLLQSASVVELENQCANPS
jgi:hypothetical protein